MLDFTTYSKFKFEFKLNGEELQLKVRKLGLDLATELDILETKEKSIQTKMEAIFKKEKSENPKHIIVVSKANPELTPEPISNENSNPNPLTPTSENSEPKGESESSTTDGSPLDSPNSFETLSEESQYYREYTDLGIQNAKITMEYIRTICPELKNYSEFWNLTQDELYFVRLYLYRLSQEIDSNYEKSLSPEEKKTEESNGSKDIEERDSLFEDTEGSQTERLTI